MITSQSIVHDDAFRETLLSFARTRALPAPPEFAPEWEAWNTAFSEAFRAVIASADHYCSVRVLEALLAAHGEREGEVA